MPTNASTNMTTEAESIFGLKHAAQAASKEEAPALWERYRARVRAEEARRDTLRKVYDAAAEGFSARMGRLDGIVVDEANTDDFGRVVVRFQMLGSTYWTRPINLNDDKSYKRIRDAISAAKRGGWRVAYRQLDYEPILGTFVTWNGYEQFRLGRNRYGYEKWRQ
jgi:hypothetical protein